MNKVLIIVVAVLGVVGCKSPDEKLAPHRSSLNSVASRCTSGVVILQTYVKMAKPGNVLDAKNVSDAREKAQACAKDLSDQKDEYQKVCTPLLDSFTCQKQAETIIDAAAAKEGVRL
jgi:hypothetical protein